MAGVIGSALYEGKAGAMADRGNGLSTGWVAALIDAARDHLKASISTNEVGLEISKRFRHFVKLWFDFLKNAILVVALKVIADKTHNGYIIGLYLFSYSLLIVYCVSYFHGYHYFPFYSQKRSPLRFVLIIGMAALTALRLSFQ